jgi:DNA-binding transcriptional MerR regulator
MNIQNIELKNKTAEFWQLLLQFFIELGKETGLESSDIQEFLGLSTERNPDKLKIKLVAEQYCFLDKETQELMKADENHKALPYWSDLDKYAQEHLSKIKRIENFEANFISFFNSLTINSGIYKKALDLIELVTEIDRQELNKMSFDSHYQLFTQIASIPNEETVQGFFFMKRVRTVLSNTILLNFIEIVKKTIQKKQLSL